MEFVVTFYEIEHTGDMRRARHEIMLAGGEVVKETVNYEEECAHFRVKAENQEKFMAKLEDIGAVV